ncbi:hypothetical protein SAMN05443575_1434 [Jatrophihabitans endophyticus]|uniref:Uncharacterized protein n=1 Tax=Jatrophihabitans endophyticus TaxID=1206085 RepID=A0A1M5H8X1_9ACTN|nr:hypothetical protein SAMN05443575_1434 [Jatrophihabitans endophyticus]
MCRLRREPSAYRASLLVNGQHYASGPTSYPGLAVPMTADPELTPDNVDETHGAVRDLRSGEVIRLRFAGWAVQATAGRRLLLVNMAHRTFSDPLETHPSAWCVLPSPNAPRSQCAPLPGAGSVGTAAVSSSGSVFWAPAHSTPLRVGETAVNVAAGPEGRILAAGTGTPGRRGSTGLPIGVDQRTVVFLPGPRGPGGRRTLQWAHVATDGKGRRSARLHTTGERYDDDLVWASPTTFASDATGSRLVVAPESAGNDHFLEFTAGGGRRVLPALRLPENVGSFHLFSWPFATSPASS